MISRDDTVLIIDDFPTMRRIVRTLLGQLGFSGFVEAESAQEALGYLMDEQHHFGLIICDTNMPLMTGVDFVKSIYSQNEFEPIPIIMVSSEADKSQAIEAVQGGAQGYVVKPFTVQILKEKISQAERTFKSVGLSG